MVDNPFDHLAKEGVMDEEMSFDSGLLSEDDIGLSFMYGKDHIGVGAVEKQCTLAEPAKVMPIHGEGKQAMRQPEVS